MKNDPDERKGLPSCSSFARYDACPGSWELCKEAPPEEPSEDATQGTLIHDVLAGFKPVEVLNDAQRDIFVACEAIANKARATIGVPDNAALHPEAREWFYSAASGKADILALWDRKCWIHDHKTGRGDVDDAPRNLQLLGLIACVHCNHPLDEAWVSIGGPFQREQLTIAHYSRRDIEYATQHTWDILAKISLKNAPRIPGDHCQFCRAKPICPELQAGALEPLKILPVLPPDVNKLTLAEAAKNLPDGQLEALMGQYRLRTWANEAIYAEAKRRAKEGKPLKGWVLKPETKRSSISDVMALFGRVQGFATPEEFCAKADIGNGKLKELIKEKLGLKGKAVDEKFRELTEGILAEFESEPSLVEDKE